MRWIVRLLKYFFDHIATIFEDLAQGWALVRVAIILILVLYTVLLQLHDKIGESCENVLNSTKSICHYIHCGGNHNP